MNEPLAYLEQGIEILGPFLKHHDFSFNGFESFKGSGKHFTLAKFKNDRKELILGYYSSVGQISILQDNIIKEYDKKAREGYSRQCDELRIQQSHQEFINKNTKSTLIFICQ